MLLDAVSAADLAGQVAGIDILAEMRLETAVPQLIQLLMASREPELVLGLVRALGCIGHADAASAIADYLYADSRALVVAAVQALGRIGSPTAMHRLAERMGGDHDLDRLILEVFADVQDHISLRKLSEAIASHHAHLRNLAKVQLVRIGPKAVPFVLENLRQEDADLQVNSLNVLGEIGDASTVTPIRKLLQGGVSNANVRFAAYEALAALPLTQGAYILAGGLSDPVEHVRIAAARAVDRSYNEILSLGIRNMVSSRDEDAERIVQTLIHAQADRIFLDLSGDPVFQELAVGVLCRMQAEAGAHFADLLAAAGRQEFAARIRPVAAVAQNQARKPRACVVDDSRMILSIYKNTLHALGVEPVAFEFPASALEWLKLEKPDILFTDLNMPEITGVELVRQARKFHPAGSVPMVMVTTQSDIQDHQAARAAGVDQIIIKPFDAAVLQAVLQKHGLRQNSA